MSKLPVKRNGSFVPDKPSELVELSAELKKEIDEEDGRGYEEPKELLPIVTIRQKDKKGDNGKTEIDAGGFKCYDKVYENLQDVDANVGLSVSIIMDQRSRIHWEEGNMEHPACRSRDAKTGIGKPGGLCDSCPLAQWKQNGDRPDCAEEINLLCYDHDQKMFYVFNLKRSGLKPYNNFKVLMKRSGVPLHFARVRLSTQYESLPAPHYVPVFKLEETLAIDMVRKMKEFRRQLQGSFGKTVETAVTHDDENTGEPEYSELPDGVEPVAPMEVGGGRMKGGTDDLPF